MEEGSIHTTREVEGDVLIAATVVDALSVLVLQLEGLSAEVHLAEALASTHKTLVWSAFKADGSPFSLLCCDCLVCCD